ncbi:MAG: serine hydrolase domain-containing protein [Caulobacterales bacterium]
MQQMETRIDALMARFVEPGGPGAAVAVIRGGAFVCRKAYGLADLEHSVPLTPDSVFRIASLTKQFTAVAVMMLAERGLLDIDDPVERHLTDWPDHGGAISLRRLLNHTSGVWRHDSEMIERTLRPNPPVAEVLQLIYAKPLEFEPGDRYAYNNSGYLLLGAVIAAASGRSYEDFLREEIFEPLGMGRTGILRHESVTPRRARGYVRGRERFHNARLDAMNWSHAAGALGSTLDDLRLWDRALRSHRLISAATMEVMLEPTTLNDGSAFPYGFGWGLAEYEGRRIFHHTGGISGYGCQMLHLRDENLTTIVLSNLYMFGFDQVTRGLVQAGLGVGEIVRAPVDLGPTDLAACAGDFKADEIPVRRLEVLDGGLAFAERGGPSLAPAAADCFYDRADPEIEYRFSLRGERGFQRLEMRSPLWPPTTYLRV